MDSGSNSSSWYAVQVRAGLERALVKPIEDRGYEVFCPTYRRRQRWSDREKLLERPLFSGYLFCRFDFQARLPRLVETPGVIRMLGRPDTPATIDTSEIERIREVVSSKQAVFPCAFVNQ